MRTGLMSAALIAIVIGLWWAATDERLAPAGAAREDVPGPPERGRARVASAAGSEAARANDVEAPATTKPVGATQVEVAAQPAETAPAPAVPAPVRQGPVDELERRFEAEPRASSAHQTERHVEAAFRDPTIPSDMLKSVICRQTVCRIEVRWTAQTYAGYVLGLTHAVGTFTDAVAIDPGEPEADGARLLKVYWGRNARSAQ